MNNSLPIGIFDSGLGGLTVLKELQHLLPNESFIYVGDTAHVPYGNKSKDAVIRYSNTITSFLASHNVKLIVVACNTASSVAKNQLQEKFKFPIIDVITPLYDHLCRYEKNTINKVGIIGTYNTINSQSYNEIIYKYDKNLKIISKACPLFVPIIEEGLEQTHITDEIIKLYLEPIAESNIDTLILGCTHYPIIKDQLSTTLSNDIKYITSGEPVGQWLKEYLLANDLINKDGNKPIDFYVSDAASKFKKLGSKFLSNDMINIELIQI